MNEADLIEIRTGPALDNLLARAAARRDAAWGTTVTFSPKVFLPLTNLCRNFCDYCSFRRSPGAPGEWTMTPQQVHDWLDQGAGHGCIEALFCLGDTPETTFRSYRSLLAEWGFSSTADYLRYGGQKALDCGLLPHTNAGILSSDQMQDLRPVNVSLGLMLENISPRLREKGMPHYRAKDKDPAVRLEMTETAGKLHIPFTSGILIGIGETRQERIDTLVAIRDLHRKHGHIQEVIVQNFCAKQSTPMADHPEPDTADLAWTIAVARLILDEDISVQAPPNLSPGATERLLQAGINDFGGISPVTPDYINHAHPWPQLQALQRTCADAGFSLMPRLPVYPAYQNETWLDAGLLPRAHKAQQSLTGWWAGFGTDFPARSAA